MISKWLKNNKYNKKYLFKVTHISEKKTPDDALIKYLQENLITSYRNIQFYRFHFDDSFTDDDIREYVYNQVIPKKEDQFDRNVRQGDWGEILTALIIKHFQNLIIPIKKVQWKFNKNKAVFGTDLIAFNNGNKVEDIYYYEIKTRQNPHKKEGKSTNRNYITILAYNSLLKDEQSPTESIADFLERLYVEKGDFINAAKFKDIVKNPQNYNKKFELFLIVEKEKFKEIILKELNELPPKLKPLNVTIVLIDNLGSLVNNTWHNIEEVLIRILRK